MKLRLTIGCLAALHLAVLLAGWLAPYDYAAQHREYPFAPPVRVHFIDAAGRFHLRPFVYGIVQDPAAGDYREDREHLLLMAAEDLKRHGVPRVLNHCLRGACRRKKAGWPRSPLGSFLDAPS